MYPLVIHYLLKHLLKATVYHILEKTAAMAIIWLLIKSTIFIQCAIFPKS